MMPTHMGRGIFLIQALIPVLIYSGNTLTGTPRNSILLVTWVSLSQVHLTEKINQPNCTHLPKREVKVKVAQSCPTLWDFMDYIVPWNSPGQNTGVGGLQAPSYCKCSHDASNLVSFLIYLLLHYPSLFSQACLLTLTIALKSAFA